jgi:hypothetical protein
MIEPGRDVQTFFRTGKPSPKPSSAKASGPSDAIAHSAVATGHQVLGIALQHHQAGRIAKAEAAYRLIPASDPGNFDALHLLGVAAYQLGRWHMGSVENGRRNELNSQWYLPPAAVGPANRARVLLEGAGSCPMQASSARMKSALDPLILILRNSAPCALS